MFIRNKKHVQLTQQGKIFLKSALKVLEANQECYQMIQYLHHENFGQLRIGSVSYTHLIIIIIYNNTIIFVYLTNSIKNLYYFLKLLIDKINI